MSELNTPPHAPANTDTRPMDVIRNQTEGRTSKDPRGEAASQPPPMPDVRPASTVMTAPSSQEGMIRDMVQSVISQTLRNVTVDGNPVQVSMNGLAVTTAKASASEQWASQNLTQAQYDKLDNRDKRDYAIAKKAEHDRANPPERSVMGSVTGLGSHKLKGEPLTRQHVDQHGNMVKTEDKPLQKDQHHEKDSNATRLINEKRNIQDKLNPSNFGKGHVRVLLTRADHGQKIVVNMDIASGVKVEKSDNEDDEDDVLPQSNEYYFGGFGTKFYCWKKGKLGFIDLAANGKFEELK